MANNRSVLFVCTYNDGRFQMAAGYLNHLAGGLIEVRSAEPPPADSIDPVVVEAMLEEGIDLIFRKSEIVTADALKVSNVVITMACGDAYPLFRGKRYLDWKLDDPAGQDLDAVRPIRNEIRWRVENLIIAELQPSG